MMKKLILAVAVVVASVAFAQTSQAGGCRGYGRGHHHSRGYSYGYSRRPVVSVGVPAYGAYRSPVYGYPAGLYRSYSPYRGGYIGPSIGFGYSNFGPYYSGRGMGIGFGF